MPKKEVIELLEFILGSKSYDEFVSRTEKGIEYVEKAYYQVSRELVD